VVFSKVLFVTRLVMYHWKGGEIPLERFQPYQSRGAVTCRAGGAGHRCIRRL